MTQLEDALALAERGWAVFQCNPDPDSKDHKRPINAKGFKGATQKPRLIQILWTSEPDALIGVAMPPSTVALDVDDVAKFEAVGLDVPDGPGQRTYSGGYHRFYKTDGRRVKQTVKEIPGADTRVGGLGYVIAWEPSAFPPVDELPDAPEWLYAGDGEPSAEPTASSGSRVEVANFKMGSRDNDLTSFAGLMRRGGAGPDAILAALMAMKASGQIEQTREDPITDRDLSRIAGSIGVRGSEAVDKQRRKPPERYSGNTILEEDWGVLKYFVDELLPEGLGLIAGAPKVGKSWLILQAALEIATGGVLLDRPVFDVTPTLYYALEDGPRRAQDRLRVLMGSRNLDLGFLEFRFDAPRIGEGLEEEMDKFLAENNGGIVVVDVLARVRPPAKGKGSAYDEDYSVLKPIHDLTKSHKNAKRDVSVVFVTHLRKAGSDDPFAQIQGTTGVTGSADWSWIVKRDRMNPRGTIQVGGRDIKQEPLVEVVFDGSWTAVGTTRRTGSPQRDHIRDALLTEGDMTTGQIRDYLNNNIVKPGERPYTANSVNEKLNALQTGNFAEQTDVYVSGKNGGYKWHVLSDEEQAVDRATIRTAAITALAGKPDPRVVGIRRVPNVSRGRAGEEPPPHAPHPPHPTSKPVEPMEGVEGELGAPPPRVRPRAPAYTRGNKPG